MGAAGHREVGVMSTGGSYHGGFSLKGLCVEPAAPLVAIRRLRQRGVMSSSQPEFESLPQEIGCFASFYQALTRSVLVV